ncbi:sterol desaturase family protein [Aurantiacibacter flavus]|uniref:Sterol desaturase family protein n=1 Tax=Aurantiacibacter flavus TaxID=3145232 RepID=A0ABV0D3A4_9SPHN
MDRATNSKAGDKVTSAAATLDTDAQAAPATFAGNIKLALINAVPLATLLAVVAFWLLAPRSFTTSEWSLVIVTSAITFFILGLEFVIERHSGWRLTWKEFLTDLFYVILMATVIGWLVESFADGPLGAAKDKLGLSTPWILTLPLVVQALMVVFLIEFGQYWMHRWMHNWLPLWLTHAPHHHVTQLNAMKGAVGNPIELFLISLSVIALFDFDIVAIFCGLSMMTVISTFAHANVRSDPPLAYGFLFTTIRNHSLHHTALSYEDTRCNYGNSVIVFDRIFGTYRDGESAIVGQDDRRRLSIYEQFMFPFQPLLDKASAARAKTADADG